MIKMNAKGGGKESGDRTWRWCSSPKSWERMRICSLEVVLRLANTRGCVAVENAVHAKE